MAWCWKGNLQLPYPMLTHFTLRPELNGCHYACGIFTLVSQIVEHAEIDEHLEEIAENLIVEHLIYTISIATNNRTPGIFFPLR